ncbi:MAG: MBL fold metallo-hydrolase [Acidobacteria bacterium]|nr:MBL fold metallo-hydrolase [Acidobacteriota bacterium]
MPSDSSRFYFRQLLAGREFAQGDPVAGQMRNFAYLIGDREAKKCLVVDPAWDVPGLFDVARADGMEIVGALATHYHPDHIGGELFGFTVPGLASVQEAKGVKVHCNRNEAAGIRQVTGLSESDLETHDGGDYVEVGAVRVQLLHTPGHTPGSQCFLVDGRLVAGDTLFVEGCGRVDLPGGDAEEMYRTLTQRLATLPADTILFPGHDYGPVPSRTLGEERAESYYLQPRSIEDWMRMMG